ncbi:hypothetical protein AOQ84DRAFT_345127 [Glonium stellatum]|uniref:Uncharacterized protein n=1 Tax=Glonium stellatum TaxID=574774 RepID=A0A8E2EUR4_9PEZI|nr:hypothetical protein AOQ84DRAFT_345127 [Glonium stellatum]
MDTSRQNVRPRGPKSETTYECRTLEALESYLQSEMESGSRSLIPETVAAEFLFGINSTITMPIAQQENGSAAGSSTGLPQRIVSVEEAFCRKMDSKARVKPQRAIAKSLVEAVQKLDGFRYTERQAWGHKNDDGTRFKFVCVDSLQNRDRVANIKARALKKQGGEDAENSFVEIAGSPSALPTYDCCGSIHVKFSIQKGCIDVIYRHTPIHRDTAARQITQSSSPALNPSKSVLPALPIAPFDTMTMPSTELTEINALRKRSQSAKSESESSKRRRRKKASNVSQGETDSGEVISIAPLNEEGFVPVSQQLPDGLGSP